MTTRLKGVVKDAGAFWAGQTEKEYQIREKIIERENNENM